MPTHYTPRELIDRLVGIPTVSVDSNLPLIDFVAGYLDEWGIPYRLTKDATGQKSNLFATLGSGPGGLVLSGHTDVVPVAGQNWTNDPFTVVERDGKLFGRGTSDMKSFIAIALAMVPKFLDKKLPEPIHFALSYDEEVGCLGAADLIADVSQAGIKPRMALIGEPTSMQVVNAHKGVTCYCTRIRGVAAHSSQPQRGVSASFAAAKTIDFISTMAKEAEGRADNSTDFVPPYTTFNVGMLSAGRALNIIPAEAEVVWEHRLVPWDDEATLKKRFDGFLDNELRPWLVNQDPRAGVTTERVSGIPSLKPDPESEVEKLTMQLTGQNRAGTVAFGTEAGMFQAAGIPAVVCGPGSIDQAHQPDEWIALDQVDACVGFLDKLTDKFAA